MRGLQFAAAGLAEIAQRIHLVDQLGQVDEGSVGRKIGFEDQPPRLLGCFNHGIARKDFHPCDKRVEVDEFRDLGLVADESVGIQPRCFFDEVPLELFPLGRGPQ
jgi:hypothetical protein